jgi:uncharacterized protein YceK
MKKTLLAAVIVTTLISGCSTIDSLQNEYAYKRGTNVTEAQIKGFTVSKTSMAEVRKLLGEPQQEKKHVLAYHYQQINHLTGGIDQTIKFIFNNEDLLIDVRTIKGSQFGNPLTGV